MQNVKVNILFVIDRLTEWRSLISSRSHPFWFDRDAFAHLTLLVFTYLDQAIYCDSTGSSILTSDDEYQEESHLFTLENRHAYFLFVYFNFFFDCFLGILSCIIRLVKSMIALVVFMPRLDYSTFGRNLEQFDNGYTSYTSYIYVEAMHTHPILITFTQIIYMNILDKRRRQRHFLLVDEKQVLEGNRRKALRFRWFLLITLMNNLPLISTRRHHRRRMGIPLSNCKDLQRTSSISSLSNRTVTMECASDELHWSFWRTG